MMTSNQKIPSGLIDLIKKLKEKDSNITAFELYKEKYIIQGTKINFLTPEMILQTYSIIKKKYKNVRYRFYYDRKSPANCSWFENELRIYIWVLICYLYVNKKEIQQMTFEDWSFFQPIFYHRDPIIFEFQGILLLKMGISKWEQDEIKLLEKIIKIKTFKNKWNAIARQLYILSKKRFIKSPKQCRQRWLNYLDPSKVHCPWTFQQDLILLSSIRDNGKRWAYTVKRLLKKRTEHMVKNRYNSLINNEKKKIGNKTQNQLLVNAIKTANLAILEETVNFSFQSQKPVNFFNNQFDQSESVSLFVIKKRKAPAKKKFIKKRRESKINKKVSQLEERLAFIPSASSFQKKSEIPAEINKRKISEEHESLIFVEQQESLAAFNPFEDLWLNDELLIPNMDFYNEQSSECVRHPKAIDLQDKADIEVQKDYVFY